MMSATVQIALFAATLFRREPALAADFAGGTEPRPSCRSDPEGSRPMIVWLASYPRSGNTFLRVVLGSVFGLDTFTLYDERPEVDPARPEVPPLPVAGSEPEVGIPFDVVRFAGQTRLHVVKTHGLPTDGRPAIYVVRDGREATASYFHYHRDVLQKTVSLRDVIRGRVGFGSWGRHVAQWNPQRRPNTLLLRFEELTANPIAQVERIGAFLGVPPVGRRVPTFEELHRTAPNFFRSGRTDSWKRLLSGKDHSLFWDLHGADARVRLRRSTCRDGSVVTAATTAAHRSPPVRSDARRDGRRSSQRPTVGDESCVITATSGVKAPEARLSLSARAGVPDGADACVTRRPTSRL